MTPGPENPNSPTIGLAETSAGANIRAAGNKTSPHPRKPRVLKFMILLYSFLLAGLMPVHEAECDSR
jgi:hypothetical protein